MRVLVSGSSGLVGSALVPFLKAEGHRVSRLVRRTPQGGGEEIFWDPQSGILEVDSLEGIDVVVSLAGENIGEGRWTEEKKKRILESRVMGTGLLSETLSKLDPSPKVLVCASAVGYYGDTGDRMVSEEEGPGDLFLSKVCLELEVSAKDAERTGIRVVFLRIGAVLTPAGGALGKMLLPFKLGMGGKVGSGRQFFSWVTMDDLLGIIIHVIREEVLRGPVNAVSPHPVTNLEFTKRLGKVLGRPTLVPVPALAVRALFGQMGEEVLLAGTRVEPRKLADTNYPFRYPYLEQALRHLLGHRDSLATSG